MKAVRKTTIGTSGLCCSLLVCLLRVDAFQPVLARPSLLVTNPNDGGTGSLRQLLAIARPADTISFAVRGTILLTNGELEIGKDLNLEGPGATNLVVSAAGQSRIFNIPARSRVTISDITISDGHALDGENGASNNPTGGKGADGGGIYNAGVLALEGCIISNCVAGKGGDGYLTRDFAMPAATSWLGGNGGCGGGIYNAGKLVVRGSTILSNLAGTGGGGGGARIYGADGGNGGSGGAICNLGTVAFFNSVFEGNQAGAGGPGYTLFYTFYDPNQLGGNKGGNGGDAGAICDATTRKLNIAECQFSYNLSGAGGPGSANTADTGYSQPQVGAFGGPGGRGGALYAKGPLHLTRCTFLSNQTGAGGSGIFGWVNGGQGGPGGQGGAIYGMSQMDLVDCSYVLNRTGAGGAGARGNSAAAGSGGTGGDGGAICALGRLSVSGSVCASNFTGAGGNGGNSVSHGGAGGIGGLGGAIWASGELSATGFLCASNFAGSGGSGGYASAGHGGAGGGGGSGGGVYAASARFVQSTFIANSAGQGGRGASAFNFSFPFSSVGANGGMGGSAGAVYCGSDLRATNCLFSSNWAGNGGSPGAAGGNDAYNIQSSTSGSDGGRGGAILSQGLAVLHACTVNGNAGGNGASADFTDNSSASVRPALQSGPLEGALASNPPHPNIILSTRYGGPGGVGGTGGIHSENNLIMVLCTVSSNAGGSGGKGGASSGSYMGYISGGPGGPGGAGAISCAATNGLVACTITTNHGGSGGRGGSGVTVPDNSGRTGQGSGGAGGAGGVFEADGTGSTDLINTIVALNAGGAPGTGGPYSFSSGNPGAPDLQGVFSSLGNNLIGAIDGSSGFTNGENSDLLGSAGFPLDPVLGPLADNGGPTLTMALLHGSPALDAGADGLLHPPYSLGTDQRGFPRQSGSHVDIGAFESQYSGSNSFALKGASFLSAGVSVNGGMPVTQDSSPRSTGASQLAFQLMFANNTPGATFTVLASTNLSSPVAAWTVLGQPLKLGSGIFSFTDQGTSSYPQRFYRVSSP